MTATRVGTGAKAAALFICGHARDEIALPALGLPGDATTGWLDDLCQRPEAIKDLSLPAGVTGLALGMCGSGDGKIELASHARKIGLDPFGMQVVPLGIRPIDVTRATRTLRAAYARAAAYPGSQPANSKVVFPGMDGRVSRRALFTLPPMKYVVTPTVDRSLCAVGNGCDQCVSACPHDAISADGNRVYLDRDRCKSCGICVAACPARAVEFPGYSAPEIEAQVAAFLYGDPDQAAPSISFTCNGVDVPEDDGWDHVRVACADMVPTAGMLGALAAGAGAVKITSCGDGCPNSGASAASGRSEYCRALLTKLGMDPTRIGGPEITTRDDAPEPLPPFPGIQSNGAEAPHTYGRLAAATAIGGLARMAEAGDVDLEHEASPLGVVNVDTDVCTACGTCVGACPTDALHAVTEGERWTLNFDPALCVACGDCTRVCPEASSGAINVRTVTDIGALREGPVVLKESEQALCEQCGKPVASSQMLQRLAEMLDDDASVEWMGRLCTECRGLPR